METRRLNNKNILISIHFDQEFYVQTRLFFMLITTKIIREIEVKIVITNNFNGIS